MNEKDSWLYPPETDIDRDALYLMACSYVWKRGVDIEAGWELVRSVAKPQPLLKTIAEVGLVEAGARSIALVEGALTSGQLRFEDGGPCPEAPSCCSGRLGQVLQDELSKLMNRRPGR